MTDHTDTDTLPPPDGPLTLPERPPGRLGWTDGYTVAIVHRLRAEARAQEREACAKLCDPEPVDPWDSYTARNNKATMRLLAQRIRARGDTAPDPRDERIRVLTEALRFYAQRDHFIVADDDAWDTVSGEPPNLWCDEAGTATVEDGSVARAALGDTDGR